MERACDGDGRCAVAAPRTRQLQRNVRRLGQWRRPVLALSRTDPDSVAQLRSWVRRTLAEFRAGRHRSHDPGPMAPHFHAGEDGVGTVHSHA